MIHQLYLAHLREYTALQQTLHAAVEAAVSLKGVAMADSILAQIRQWPDGEFIQPALWVTPPQGDIEVAGESWRYLFHGAGLSLMNEAGQEVSIEYSATGDLAFTERTTLAYVETLPADEHPHGHKFVRNHAYLFEQALSAGHFIDVPPLLAYDEQTYQLRPESETET